MLTFVLLMLIIIPACLADNTHSLPQSDSHSKSHRSHSHHSHSHHSESQSRSQGICPHSGLVAATPRNASRYHDVENWPCYYSEYAVDNTTGARTYYPCILSGGLTLAPTSVSLQLSEGGASDGGNNWVNVVLWYNFTHYNHLHPDKIVSCFNEPTPGPHNPPFLRLSQYNTFLSGCDRICAISNSYIVQCGADYLTAKSGEYYIEIPYVGRFNFNVSVCFKEKFHNDYATQCFADMDTCPANVVTYTSGGSTSLDGVRFASLWTMTLAMAALLLL